MSRCEEKHERLSMSMQAISFFCSCFFFHAFFKKMVVMGRLKQPRLYKPRISRGSREIANRMYRGTSFLDRQQNMILRKQAREQQARLMKSFRLFLLLPLSCFELILSRTLSLFFFSCLLSLISSFSSCRCCSSSSSFSPWCFLTFNRS